MDFYFPTNDERIAGFRGLFTVATSDGPLNDLERGVAEAAMRVFGFGVELDRLEPIGPEALAAALPRPEIRHQLLGGLLIISMADGDVNEAEAATVAAFARAFGIEDSAVANLSRVAARHYRLARLDIVRRHWTSRKLRDMAEIEGWHVWSDAVLGLLGVTDFPEIIARYRAFEQYPAGSLGRAYFDYMMENGFSFPGEKGAPPEAMLYHDLSHILSGYGTTPHDEILVVAFSAGYSTVEVLNWFMFGLTQFQLAIQIAPGAERTRLQLDPDALIAAYRRGAALNVDLNDGWDPWPLFGEPVEAVRAQLNVLPVEAFPVGRDGQ